MRVDFGKLTREETVEFAVEALRNLDDDDAIMAIETWVKRCALEGMAGELEVSMKLLQGEE